MSWRAAGAALALGAIFSAPVPTAAAKFGPIELISKNTREQADRAAEPAISADGRYVVFTASIGGRSGIFRKDLATGALEPVAEGGSGASISADGRYVAFTTAASLDPVSDDPPPPATASADNDVYVADMASSPPGYAMASVRDRCDPRLRASCGLTYSSDDGALAAAGVALSADGRRVAFVVAASSNLTGPEETPETPPGQVALRDLDAGSTTLISVRRAGDGATTAAPVPGGAVYERTLGATLSADGGTVAWLGRRLPEQVPMLLDERASVEDIEARRGDPYNEPLWRRVPTAVEPAPPTRRVVGGGDPLAPGCPPTGTLSDPACQGPYLTLLSREVPEDSASFGWLGEGRELPRLSADGETVALVGDPEQVADAFVVDMRAGLSRREAVRRLTHWIDPDPSRATDSGEAQYTPLLAPVESVAIAPDGGRVAFASARQLFPLAPPTLISPQPASIGAAELYQIDLAGETIERATPGPGRDVSLGVGAAAPSYAADGLRIAFASAAPNLVLGDANEASDVFLVEAFPSAPVSASEISPRPAALALPAPWRLSATAISRPDGAVRIRASVPGSGTLRTVARAQIGPRLRIRELDSARRRPSSARVLRLDLRLRPALLGLARRKGGLAADLRVAFVGPGGKPLRKNLVARFRIDREPERARG